MMLRMKKPLSPINGHLVGALVLCFLCVIGKPEATARGQSQTAPPPQNAAAIIPSFNTPMAGKQFFTHVLFDQLEDRPGARDTNFRWDGEGWFGSDFNRLWLKSEGFAGAGSVTDGDHEALYDRPIPRLRYFDGQIGMRADLDSGPPRLWAAVGVEGFAPWFFQMAPTVYIRDEGRVAGRIVGSYDLLLTQRLIVQPEAELNFYSKDDPARKTGSGLSDLDGGLRMRYECSRKFAPYVGWAYHGNYGNSAVYAREAHERTNDSQFVFGIRAWY